MPDNHDPGATRVHKILTNHCRPRPPRPAQTPPKVALVMNPTHSTDQMCCHTVWHMQGLISQSLAMTPHQMLVSSYFHSGVPLTNTYTKWFQPSQTLSLTRNPHLLCHPSQPPLHISMRNLALRTCPAAAIGYRSAPRPLPLSNAPGSAMLSASGS